MSTGNKPLSASSYDTSKFKCLRNSSDGSVYYGDVAYINREGGQLILRDSPAYAATVEPLPED